MNEHGGHEVETKTLPIKRGPIDGIIREKKWWPYSILTVGWVVAAFAASSVLVGLIIGLLRTLGVNFQAIDQNVYGVGVSIAVYAILLALVLGGPRLFKLWSSKISYPKLLGLTRLLEWRDILFAILAFVVYLAGSVAVQAIATRLAPGFDPTQAQDLPFSKVLSDSNRIIVFLALVVVAPVAEEVVFRGYLFGTLRRSTRVWVAALVTSIVFGVIHLQVNVGLDVLVLSLVSCFLRYKTGSLWASILLHMFKNGLAFYLLYVATTI